MENVELTSSKTEKTYISREDAVKMLVKNEVSKNVNSGRQWLYAKRKKGLIDSIREGLYVFIEKDSLVKAMEEKCNNIQIPKVPVIKKFVDFKKKSRKEDKNEDKPEVKDSPVNDAIIFSKMSEKAKWILAEIAKGNKTTVPILTAKIINKYCENVFVAGVKAVEDSLLE